MNFYLATSNKHKIAEFARLLAARGWDRIAVRGAGEAGGMPPVEETADTFEGNARLKARALKKRVGADGWVLADDSGLVVDALGGAPGVRSSRFAGESASDEANNAKLLRELAGKPRDRRSARFCCCLILISPDGGEEAFAGVCEGHIAEHPAGLAGFGYDPLFVPEGCRATFAELGDSAKNRISHRALAWERLMERLDREG